MSTEEGKKRGYASPPCFMRELDPAYGGFGKTEDPALRSDVMRWRKVERSWLIALRQRIALPERLMRAKRIAERLDALLGYVAGLVVSGYWPIKGKPDRRD